MRNRVLAVAIAALLMTTAAFAQKVSTDWDRGANFAEFHTYSWEKSPHPAKDFWNDRIINAVDQQLQAKGLTKVDSNPDLWVVYSNSIHDQKEIVGTGYNFGPRWYWGWGGGGMTQTTYNTIVTKEGTLVVEVADAKNKQLLWRGAVSDTISSNSDKNIKTLDKAVTKLFKNYPPKQK